MGETGLTILVGIVGVAGTVTGAIAGALLPRWVKRVGQIHCKATVADSVAVGVAGTIEDKPALPIDFDTLGAAADITFWIDVEIFNEKETPTGLRDLAVVFRGSGVEIRCPVYEKMGHYSPPKEIRPPQRVQVINLAPGQWKHLEACRASTRTPC